MEEVLREKFLHRIPEVQREDNYLDAAVLVPLVEVAGRTHVLFEVRSKELRRQPGEISFPGGKIDPGEDAREAAVREAHEELQVPLSSIELLGPLDYILSPTGVRLFPYVGRVLEPVINASPAEVDEIFTVPLDELLEMEPQVATMEMGTRPVGAFPFDKVPGYEVGWKSRRNFYVYFYTYKQYEIWGLTALVLRNFLQLYKTLK